MWSSLLFIASVLLVTAVGLALLGRFDPWQRRIRGYEAELTAREPVPDDDLFRRYFAEGAYGEGNVAADVPARVRQIFAKHMEYPAEKLLPDDDLTFFWAELDMADLIDELDSTFGITLTDKDLERTPCTIRAVSLLVDAKRRTHAC